MRVLTLGYIGQCFNIILLVPFVIIAITGTLRIDQDDITPSEVLRTGWENKLCECLSNQQAVTNLTVNSHWVTCYVAASKPELSHHSVQISSLVIYGIRRLIILYVRNMLLIL